MNYYRWEESIQLKINFLHHSWHSPVFTRDHLEMRHQFRVIRRVNEKLKHSQEPIITHLPGIRVNATAFQIEYTNSRGTPSWNGDSRHRWESYDIEIDLLLDLSFTPYMLSTLHLITHSLESVACTYVRSLVVTQYILHMVLSLRVHF